jgi:hypothetical protein
VPPLAAGVAYVEIATNGDHALGRRSDGKVVQWGDGRFTLRQVPPLAPGQRYDAMACGGRHALACREDGELVAWGDGAAGQCVVPTLLPGRWYSAFAAGDSHSLLLQANGFVMAVGANGSGQCTVPVLPPGRVYHAVAAGRAHSVARYGAPRLASHTVVGQGCGDPVLELVALGQPSLHDDWTLETRAIPTTTVLGVHVLGATDPALPDLAAFGAPGCGLFASLDVLAPFAPSGPTQAWTLALPHHAALAGMHVFATTVLWLDPAPNAAGVITTNGIDGVLGV